MKKLVALMIGLFALVATSQAQIEVSPFMGYTFGDKFYAGRIGDGMSWGASVAYPIKRFASIEFTYTGQKGEAESYYANDNEKFDMTSNYYLLGLVKNIPVAKKISVFGGFGMGVAVYDPTMREYESATQFGFSLKTGVKFWINDRFGLFVQANANFPITDVNADVWWTIGGGPDGGLSTSTPFTQIGLNGGLVFKLGNLASTAK
ncbi:MAG: outer membrane beta-barrel protein [Mangrovibacterium sp.]